MGLRRSKPNRPLNRSDRADMGRTLVILGLVLIAAGLLWPLLGRLGLGRLPGDIVIQRGNFTFYAPLGTGLLVSFVLTLLLWLLHR
jgi:hypothetical protein